MNAGFRFFIFYFPFIVLAFFDLSSLRTHFRPLLFPSENFGGHGRKVYARPRRALWANPYRAGFVDNLGVTLNWPADSPATPVRVLAKRAGLENLATN